jgi:hypothetical protein
MMMVYYYNPGWHTVDGKLARRAQLLFEQLEKG